MWSLFESVAWRRTGILSARRSESAYGGSSVHSNRIARIFAFFATASDAILTMPGVTRGTSTFSPFATASKPSTFSQPSTWKRAWRSGSVTCAIVSILLNDGRSDSPLAVSTRNSSSTENEHERMWHCMTAEMKHGSLAWRRASFW